MLEFHTLFNEKRPLSVENSRVTKGLTCNSPPVPIGASYQSKQALWAEFSYCGIAQAIMEDV